MQPAERSARWGLFMSRKNTIEVFVMPELTAERVRELFDYNPSDGVLKWKQLASGRKKSLIAGTKHPKGYLSTNVDGRLHKNHRLIWLFMYGSLPENQIDHINGNNSDNRIENLRNATDKINRENRRCAQKNNKSTGLLGAYWSNSSKCYRAQIKVNGKQYHVGLFETAIDAHNAYVIAKRQLHAGCTI